MRRPDPELGGSGGPEGHHRDPVAVRGAGDADGLHETAARAAQIRGAAGRVDRAVAAHEPEPGAARRDLEPDDGCRRRDAAHRVRVAEGEDAPVGRDDPVAVPDSRAAMPTIGRADRERRRSSRGSASPKLKMPPSERRASSRDRRGVGAIPTIGWLRCIAPVEPWKRASPKLKMPPSEATSQ